MLPAILLVLMTFALCAWLTGQIRRYAITRRVIDVPNERSSHRVPTPRGGGLAIATAVIASTLAAAAAGWVDRPQAFALAIGGALVAAIGFADDVGSLRRRWRLLGHFAAAALVLGWAGGFPRVAVLNLSIEPGLATSLLAAVYIVWMINLTNFMDGIDGIASTEAVVVAGCGAALFAVAVPGSAGWLPPVLLAAAAAGFLVWNWPPASIFMGDSGSGFLGLALATLSIHAAAVAPPLFWSWVILLGVFVVDATVTLVRRAITGQRIFEAHRTHAYQHAAARYGSHVPVTLAVGAITLFWLLPLAAVVAIEKIDGFVGVIVAYAPLAALALRLDAGRTYNDDQLP